MKKLMFLMVGCALLSSCSLTQKTQAFIDKVQQRCKETKIVNPESGNVEVYYHCDSLWATDKIKAHCSQANIYVDVASGSVSGALVCDSVVDVKALIKKFPLP